MDKIKAKMQALRTEADVAIEKADKLEITIKEYDARHTAVSSNPFIHLVDHSLSLNVTSQRFMISIISRVFHPITVTSSVNMNPGLIIIPSSLMIWILQGRAWDLWEEPQDPNAWRRSWPCWGCVIHVVIITLRLVMVLLWRCTGVWLCHCDDFKHHPVHQSLTPPTPCTCQWSQNYHHHIACTHIITCQQMHTTHNTQSEPLTSRHAWKPLRR